MANKISIELLEYQLKEFKKEDLQKKVDIAANVVKQCEQRAASNLDVPTLQRCATLTGVAQETLIAVGNLEEATKKFDEWLFEQKEMLHDCKFQYNKFRKRLIDNYTKLQKIPTRWKEDKTYRGLNKFYTTLQLPGTRFSIVVENPETVLERHRFLKAKMEYREVKKNIVYIGKSNLLINHGKFSFKEDADDMKNRFIIAASPKYGIVQYIYSCGTKLEYLNNWIEEKVIRDLQEESVVIFQENVLVQEDDINCVSSKEDMSNWLKRNNIDHDPNAHRADMFKLITTFKNSCQEQLTAAEQTIRSHGHITIRKKKCNLNHNYFDPFWEFLLHELNTNTSQSNEEQVKGMLKFQQTHMITRIANMIVQNVPANYWANLDALLAVKEDEIFREDLEIEDVLDKLFTLSENETITETWAARENLDLYSKSMEQPLMFLSDTVVTLYKSRIFSGYD